MREDSVLHRIGMARSRRNCLGGILLGCLLAVSPVLQAFEPPLNIPAIQDERLPGSPMLAVVDTGERLVAAGLRGAIIFSEDQGASWTQAQVPVSVDLVAMTFPSGSKGWAVGQGGVVLHSSDGGKTWRKQLDGLQAAKLAIDFYSRNPEQLEHAEAFLLKEQNLAADNETQPFLDVYFADERHGYVVGTFNRIFATVDGGQSWAPRMHLTDNPQEWHFYAVSGGFGQLYLSGEQGHVWRLDPRSGRFLPANTPYNGTLFGVLPGGGDKVYAYGMRGSFFRSADRGRTWQRTTLPFGSNVMRVLLPGDGRLLLVAQGGEVAQSRDDGQSFDVLPVPSGMPYFGATLLDQSRLAVAGALGVRIEAF